MSDPRNFVAIILTVIGLLAPAAHAQLAFDLQPLDVLAIDAIGRTACHDMDGVNGPDLVASSEDFGGFTYVVVRNDGSGGFDHLWSQDVGVGGGHVVAGDWDGDGLADVIGLEDWGINDRLRLLRQTSPGTWASVDELTLFGTRTRIVTSDMNGDGQVDIVLGRDNGIVEVLLNDGSGGIAALTATSYGGDPVTDLVCCDLNSDGKPDVASISATDDTLIVRMNDGAGGLLAPLPTAYIFPGNPNPSWMTCGDFNGNGLPDLAIALSNSDSVLVMFGDGSGGFGSNVEIDAGPTPSQVVSGDFDCDGDVDLVVAKGIGPGNPLRGLLNDGTATTWTETAVFGGATGSGAVDLFAREIDGEAGTDIIIVTPAEPFAYARPLFNVGAACGTCIDPAPDGVAWYAGDLCMPDDLYDNHTGVIVGTPFCPTPRIGGGAIGFDSSPATYTRVAHDCELDPDDHNFTINGWVRTNAPGFQPIAVKSLAPGYELSLSNGQLRAVVCDASFCWIVRGSSLINDGDWHHVAFTLQRGPGAAISVWVDGLLENVTPVPTLGTVGGTTSDLLLGASPSSTPSSFLDGSIDELQIHDRALSAAEIQAIYLAGIAGQCKTNLCAPTGSCVDPTFPGPFEGGVQDDFVGGIDPATPGPVLAASCPSAIDFDIASGGSLCHTFTALPDKLVGASLEIRVRANEIGVPCDDTIAIQATGGAPAFLWERAIADPTAAACTGTPGLLECEWEALRTHTFCLDLDQLPDTGGATSVIADMNATGRLDVRVAGNTAVDYMRLRVKRCPCPADLGGDGEIGFGDILMIMGMWGACPDPCPPCAADLNGDCTVNFADILIALSAWGPC